MKEADSKREGVEGETCWTKKRRGLGGDGKEAEPPSDSFREEVEKIKRQRKRE